jgi:cyclopropane-fatty-acyl-phospholipid synthase
MNQFLGQYLENIVPVTFRLQTSEESQVFGGGEPEFTVTLKEEISKKELLTSTSLALGDAYTKGKLEVDGDLYRVLDSFMGQMGKFTTNQQSLKKLLFTSLGKKNQKEEVSSHYDIGNDFYRLWLDESMSYSCAYFRQDSDTLYEAQINKVHHILEKLHLEEGMTLLDIGCGWGFLLKEAVKKYKVKGLGITLSREQHDKFKEDIKQEGLFEDLQVELMDYRDLKKSGKHFDRVVSVGMLEHVGRGNYETFMENVNAVLNPGGLFLLHYISAQREHPGDAWIRRYIFPGGTVPSFREIINILPDFNFYTLDVESLRRHYNKTLLCWRENFLKHRKEVVEMKGEEFARRWELYLASCAATFHNGIIDLHQILISKGINNDLPMTRIV